MRASSGRAKAAVLPVPVGLTQQVAAEHQLRDSCRLDWGGLLVAALLQRFEQGVGQTGQQNRWGFRSTQQVGLFGSQKKA